jgi:3-deoxy-manno-octulosonate cytidylyltransferase (CMP-KDO synthetase)
MTARVSDPSFHVVIPARYASTRLPGKPLRLIAGEPMIYHVYQNARRSGATSVVVATDDERIRDAVASFGGEALMTSEQHASGTDRIAEVRRLKRWDDDAVIVNLQGDEPALDPALLKRVAHVLHEAPEMGIATLATPIERIASLFDPNVVKVVIRDDGLALYFSRAPIPWVRDAFGTAFESDGLPREGAPPPETTFLRHLGLYVYRAWALEQLAAAPAAELERAEALEQLRALSLGISIGVTVIEQAPPHGVDTEADLERVNQQFIRHGGPG